MTDTPCSIASLHQQMLQSPDVLHSIEALQRALPPLGLTANTELKLIASDWPKDALLALFETLQVLRVSLCNITHAKSNDLHGDFINAWSLGLCGVEHETLHAHLSDFEYPALDLFCLPIDRPPIRFACFDMDSTLIEIEVIDELAKRAGVGEDVARITRRAMQGELDFKQSFTARMALLNGLPAAVIDSILAKLPITDGAASLIAALRERQIKSAIFSGGFTEFAKPLAAKLGIDYVHANALPMREGLVTGEIALPIVDSQYKRQLLIDYCDKLGISLKQALAVGDGANDLPMLMEAGIGVAFRAKPVVRAEARFELNHHDLSALVYLLGH